MTTIKLQAEVLKALGSEARLQIIYALKEKETCVCDLQRLSHLSMPTISKHLSVLKAAGLVSFTKEGTKVIYKLEFPCVINFLACLGKSVCKGEKDA